MSNQPSITIVLANRPRLFRELLQHALKTEVPQARVVEAPDGTLSPSLLREANWLVIDEESTASATKMSAANPQLGILVLDGRGSSARLLTPSIPGAAKPFSDSPRLSELFSLLSQAAIERVAE